MVSSSTQVLVAFAFVVHGAAKRDPFQEQIQLQSVESCDSLKDLYETMLENDRQFELFLGIAGAMAALGMLFLGSCMLGARTKYRPPPYWKNRPWNLFYDDFYEEVDVTTELKNVVQDLLNMSTKKEYMGLGRDGNWATHKGFKVLRVTRIESGRMWSAYSQLKADKVMQVNRLLVKMPTVWRQYTNSAMNSIEMHQQLFYQNAAVKVFLDSLRLDRTRNEQIMFHGSPGAGARHASGAVLFPSEDSSPVYAIKQSGFDERLGSVKGMYGSGTYFSDMASKADQYAGQYNAPGSPQGSVGERATMFLARVTLGTPYKTDQSLEQLRRPPCIHGHFDLNLYWNLETLGGKPWREKGLQFMVCDHDRFDSVLADYTIDGKKRLYREYIVYDKQAYPEFCVTYERIA